jgi:hypothetical protein
MIVLYCLVSFAVALRSPRRSVETNGAVLVHRDRVLSLPLRPLRLGLLRTLDDALELQLRQGAVVELERGAGEQLIDKLVAGRLVRSRRNLNLRSRRGGGGRLGILQLGFGHEIDVHARAGLVFSCVTSPLVSAM